MVETLQTNIILPTTLLDFYFRYFLNMEIRDERLFDTKGLVFNTFFTTPIKAENFTSSLYNTRSSHFSSPKKQKKI